MTLGTGIPSQRFGKTLPHHNLWRIAFAVAFGLLIAACSNAGFPSSESVRVDESDQETGQAGSENDSEPIPTTPSDPSAVAPSDAGLPITVTRVIDGDSVEVDSAEGDLVIRLLGLNAPEGDECFGPEAAELLEDLFGASSQSGTTLHPWPGETDEFGRQLGFLVVDEIFVNLRLLELGASVARAQSDHEFIGEFERAEQSAVDAGLGLWASDACGIPVAAELAIVDALANAPGDDRENPNGEWVVIGNLGDQPVELEGWGIRDESTRHRFTFPQLTLDAGQTLRLRSGCDDNDLDAEPIDFHWCDPEPPIWNNGGDRAFLLDPNGTIVDSLAVGG